MGERERNALARKSLREFPGGGEAEVVVGRTR
jgi:hypothetical protein